MDVIMVAAIFGRTEHLEALARRVAPDGLRARCWTLTGDRRGLSLTRTPHTVPFCPNAAMPGMPGWCAERLGSIGRVRADRIQRRRGGGLDRPGWLSRSGSPLPGLLSVSNS